MNATSGILTTKRSLANAGKQTEFVAIATDTGVPPMSTTSALTIHVTNISEPLMLNVYNRTFNAATVCWEAPSEGHVTGYRVEYYEVNAPLRYTRKDLDTATQTMCHQMYDLKDGGTYVIQVQGYNSDDMGIWGNITLHLRDTVHCSVGTCKNDGVCKNTTDDRYVCNCAQGYFGLHCEHYDPCQFRPCENGATCRNTTEGSYVCDCREGYFGQNCSTSNPCAPGPCQNGGLCFNTSNSTYKCSCIEGYHGPECQHYDPCHPMPCLNGGMCNSVDGHIICDCKLGWLGSRCEEFSPCLAWDPCKNAYHCMNLSNTTYTCSCKPGWSGENCTVYDACHTKECQNGAKCISNANRTFTCLCPDAFTGYRCEHERACHISLCKNNATCIDSGYGRYVCACPLGHYGHHCENYNPCYGRPCQNDGQCRRNGVSGYQCVCRNSYYGNRCEFYDACADESRCSNGTCHSLPDGKLCDRAVDPCRSAPCLHGGKCSKTAKVAGRYQCACPTGYSGSDCQYLSTCPKAELPSSKGTYLWPETEHGNIVRLPCRVSAYGTETESFAVRFCKLTPEGSAVWTPVDGQHCKTSIMTAAEASSALNELRGDLPYLDSTYLKRALDVLELVSDFGNTNPKVAQQMFNVVSTMVGTNWTAHQPGNFTERLHTLIAKFLDEVHVEDRNGYVIDTDNIDLQVNLVTPETKSPLGIEFRSSAVSHINLPPEVATSQQERVKFVAYKNSKLFLAKVNPNVGEVIAASVSNKVIKDLRECVRYSLPKPVMGGKYKCAFWMESEKRWSGKGVQKVADSEIAMECCSSHLTNFAILFEVDPESVQHMEQDMVLTIVSYIGSGLSILGLSLTLLTYTLFRCLNKDRSGQILLNVCLSMLFMNIIFVIGSDRDHVTGNTMCTVVAVLMHYLVLSTLLWMSVEAFNMYRMLITVFVTPEKLFLVKRMLVAWGLPMVCIGIAIAVDLTVYTGIVTDYCRMSAHNPYLYYGTYFGPACAILLFNCIIFFIVVRVVIRPKFDRQSETTKINLSQVKGAMTVLVLLGVSWIFGVLAIGKAKVFFQYAFCICNAAQGFCIFIFRCLNYPDARAAWIQLFTTGTLKKRRGTVIKSTIISNSNTHSSQSKADTDYTLVSSNERLHKSPKYSPSRYAHRNPVVPSPAKSNGRCSPLLSEEERQSAFNAQERRRDNSRPHHAVLDIRGVTQPGGGHPALGTSFAESGLYNTRL